MTRFVDPPGRLNRTIERDGREYQQRLIQRSQTIFTTLLDLLPSNYVSTVQGPSYTNELKAAAVELARIELSLEDVSNDRDFNLTRSDFIYSIIGYLVLLNKKIPSTVSNSDTEFRSFVLSLIGIYFEGSTPKALEGGIALFESSNVTLKENFLLIRKGASGLDISDEFGFQVDINIPPGGGFPPNAPQVEAGIRLILDILRPAHTLFTIRYVFVDQFTEKIQDSLRWDLADYHYEDIRRYWSGVPNRDRLGVKQNRLVTGEDHTKDF